MPLYEYECLKCHRRSEFLQRFADDAKTICEHCGGELKKLLSAPMVQFKGSGWYVTDYGAKKPAVSRSESNGTANGKSSESGEGSAGSKKSEGGKTSAAAGKKSQVSSKSAGPGSD